MSWRIGVWCAVSSKPQAADDKVSLEDQRVAGERFAEQVGGEVVATYSVPGHSRDLIFYQEAERQMEAYRRLREDVEAERLDVLFCLDVDRLGRDPALGQQVISLVEKGGGEVYMQSAPHQLGQKTMAHRYISAIQSVRAGEDQALRLHRYRSGMRGRIRRGLMANAPPLGYAMVRNEQTGEVVGYEFTPDIAAVDRVINLFLQGHSYSEIRRRMDESGFSPPGGGDRWPYDIIRYIPKNDAYAGLPSWGSVQPAEPSALYPARWSPELHRRIIHERNRRRDAGYFRKGASPFRGIAYCARCGKQMGRATVRGRYYLRCSRHAARATQGRECHANTIPEWRVVDAIADFLDEYVTPERVEETLARWGGGNDLDAINDELESRDRELTTLAQQRDRLALAYAQGGMDLEQYRRTDDRLLGQLEEIHKRAGELRQARESVPDLDERRALLQSLSEGFRLIMAVLEPVEVSQALQAAGIVVFIEEGQPAVGLR